MDAIYLICLLVGGFFVLLSLFGGGDTDHSIDSGSGVDAGHSLDTHTGDMAHDLATPSASPGLVDIISIRTLFLFAAFFGLSGKLLGWSGTDEPFTFAISLMLGMIIGVGGNFMIRRMTEERVSSDIQDKSLYGQTARVTLPFETGGKGKISLVAGGRRIQLIARPLADDTIEEFRPGDEVVVVRMAGTIAEVVKPT